MKLLDNSESLLYVFLDNTVCGVGFEVMQDVGRRISVPVYFNILIAEFEDS